MVKKSLLFSFLVISNFLIAGEYRVERLHWGNIEQVKGFFEKNN